MMHFVGTFSINRAEGVRLAATEEVRNYGKNCRPTSRTFLKMEDAYPSS